MYKVEYFVGSYVWDKELDLYKTCYSEDCGSFDNAMQLFNEYDCNANVPKVWISKVITYDGGCKWKRLYSKEF